MPQIYIANTSLHKTQFNYRLPKKWNDNGKATEWLDTVVEEIPPGEQICLSSGKSFTDRECEALVTHHARYGMVRAGEHKKGFRGLVFELNKPVNTDRVQEALKANSETAEERSDAILRQTVAANLDAQRKFAQQAGVPPPDRSEMEIVEQPKKGDPTVAKGVEALADGVQPNRQRRAS